MRNQESFLKGRVKSQAHFLPQTFFYILWSFFFFFSVGNIVFYAVFMFHNTVSILFLAFQRIGTGVICGGTDGMCPYHYLPMLSLSTPLYERAWGKDVSNTIQPISLFILCVCYNKCQSGTRNCCRVIVAVCYQWQMLF